MCGEEPTLCVLCGRGFAVRSELCMFCVTIVLCSRCFVWAGLRWVGGVSW